jgi:hypothetical protein
LPSSNSNVKASTTVRGTHKRFRREYIAHSFHIFSFALFSLDSLFPSLPFLFTPLWLDCLQAAKSGSRLSHDRFLLAYSQKLAS